MQVVGKQIHIPPTPMDCSGTILYGPIQDFRDIGIQHHPGPGVTSKIRYGGLLYREHSDQHSVWGILSSYQ